MNLGGARYFQRREDYQPAPNAVGESVSQVPAVAMLWRGKHT